MSKLALNDFSTFLFDWGRIKWRISPETQADVSMSFGDVVVLPGKGHSRHDHPDADEIIYVLAGSGEQMIDDAPPFAIGPGDVFYIPKGVPHSTLNTGWATLHLLVVYNPGGPETALRDLPDFQEVEAGQIPPMTNSN